ncbi:uncharacterized protein PSFLO_03522 [Pseudozyma flocculosa]|uniref:Uncharacterized protein n=1 Tax=Pseudozyma flocculosa TaxID=84751 RepID=A0A5C3F226_9BASI|nr:uncharacterized protein PSFLO_03522 [Pseudozyma flocculosa]
MKPGRWVEPSSPLRGVGLPPRASFPCLPACLSAGAALRGFAAAAAAAAEDGRGPCLPACLACLPAVTLPWPLPSGKEFGFALACLWARNVRGAARYLWLMVTVSYADKPRPGRARQGTVRYLFCGSGRARATGRHPHDYARSPIRGRRSNASLPPGLSITDRPTDDLSGTSSDPIIEHAYLLSSTRPPTDHLRSSSLSRQRRHQPPPPPVIVHSSSPLSPPSSRLPSPSWPLSTLLAAIAWVHLFPTELAGSHPPSRPTDRPTSPQLDSTAPHRTAPPCAWIATTADGFITRARNPPAPRSVTPIDIRRPAPALTTWRRASYCS